MFGKRTQSTVSVTDAMWLLSWSRSPQDYLQWTEIQLHNPFKNLFEEVGGAVVQLDKEWILVSNSSEFKQIFQTLVKKAKDSENHEEAVLLKAFEYAPKKFRVLPKLVMGSASRLPFLPKAEIGMEPELRVLFLEFELARDFIEKKKKAWYDKLGVDQFESFVSSSLQQKIHALYGQDYSTTSKFPQSSEIWQSLDDQILKSNVVTLDYLKNVWLIPHFVYQDQEEMAVMVRLQIQRLYEKNRPHLPGQYIKTHQAKFLQWSLSHPFTDQEVHMLQPFSIDQTSLEFVSQQVFALYRKILEKCGVSAEFMELYGVEEFLIRITNVFSSFPGREGLVQQLEEPSFFRVLIEEVVRFSIKHTAQIRGSSKDLLQALLEILVKRVRLYKDQS